MIILDTNVISEAMKPHPHPAVRAWLNAQALGTLYIASVTLSELLFGIGALPAGRRKDALTQALDGLLKLFAERILPFDTDSARCYAELAVAARTAGRGFPIPAGYIAATAAAHRFAVATRDVAPFLAAELTVIDPWSATP